MKIAVSTYSFGKYVESLGIDEIIRLTKEYGAEGIDVADESGSFEEKMEKAKVTAESCAKHGVELACYCVGADFINGSEGDLQAEIDKVCKKVDIAEAYGFKVMRHDTAYGPKKGELTLRSFDSNLERIVEGCRAVTQYAKSKGIVTCTENHGFFAQDSDRVEKIVNGVCDDNFGALVDMGNFMCADEAPEKAVSIMAQYAKHVHAKDFYWKSGMMDDPGEGWFKTRCKDYLKGAIIGHGVVPVRQCLNILKSAKYDGWVAIEFEGMEDNLKGVRIGVANLKKAIEMLK